MPTLACCPQCGQPDALATIEKLDGRALINRVTQNDVTAERAIEHGGYTEIIWDSAQSVGMMCRNCRWERLDAPGDLAIDHLLREDLVRP